MERLPESTVKYSKVFDDYSHGGGILRAWTVDFVTAPKTIVTWVRKVDGSFLNHVNIVKSNSLKTRFLYFGISIII